MAGATVGPERVVPRLDWRVAWAASGVTAVVVAAVSDELRKDTDPDANGAISGDLVAMIALALVVGAIVFVGLRRWADKASPRRSSRAGLAAGILGVLLLPIGWWAGVPLVAAAGAVWLPGPVGRRDVTGPAARWATRLAVALVLGTLAAHVAAVTANTL
jgi:hypothetical protein